MTMPLVYLSPTHFTAIVGSRNITSELMKNKGRIKINSNQSMVLVTCFLVKSNMSPTPGPWTVLNCGLLRTGQWKWWVSVKVGDNCMMLSIILADKENSNIIFYENHS